jgi:exodeoxyribonuclease VII large subunit
VVHGPDGIVTTAKAAGKSTTLEIEFADGRHKVGGGAKSGSAKSAKPPEQGSLF